MTLIELGLLLGLAAFCAGGFLSKPLCLDELQDVLSRCPRMAEREQAPWYD